MRISNIIRSKNLPDPGPEKPPKVTADSTKAKGTATPDKGMRPANPPAPKAAQLPPHSPAAAAPRPFHPHTTVGAAEIYGSLVRQARSFLADFSGNPPKFPDVEEICEAVERAVEGMQSDPYKLLELIERSTPDDYLPGHLANVTILSIAVSQQLNWDSEAQRAVGMGALLHDAGMVFHRPTYSKSVPITTEERQNMRKLPPEGMEVLKTFLANLSSGSKTIVESILLSCQERISGKGYPAGLKGDQISKEAQVVGLCDTYEAVTHPRPYRPRKLPHDTLRYLIELSSDLFDGALIKTLWETLSLYPPGSFVKLNTNEIGRIVGINRKLPTRPTVKVIVSPAGQKLPAEKIVDLSQTPGVAIEKAVDECNLNLSDRRLVLELRAQKWWVK